MYSRAQIERLMAIRVMLEEMQRSAQAQTERMIEQAEQEQERIAQTEMHRWHRW